MNALGGTTLPPTAQGHAHLKYARGEPELAHYPAGHIAQCSYSTRAVGARVLHQS